MKTEWFATWFDTPYYHILYKNRNEAEAQDFIDNLVKLLAIHPNHKVLDLACGKGRHAIYLNKKGIDVTGVDLSPHNIEYAKQFENEKLHFYTGDMRKVFRSNYFDYVVNLFTSFGYFEKEEENLQTILAIKENLVANGRAVIDFLNPFTTMQKLVAEEVKVIENIAFKIEKKIEAAKIIKTISFADKGEQFSFEEKLQLISKDQFLSYFDKAGLKIQAILGDYSLNDFDEEKSDRMIFVVERL